MNEQLPDGLQLAVNTMLALGCGESSDAIRAEHQQRVTLQHNAADLAQRIAELEAERANTAAHVASIARQLGDDALQVDDIAVRVLRLVAEHDTAKSDERHIYASYVSASSERDALRAKLAAIEAQAAPDEEAAQTGFRAYDGSGWSETATPWQIWRDAVKWAISARHVPARAVPDWWRLVPVEPTQEQWNAGVRAARDYMQETEGNSPAVIYRAMIAAAPEHKA